MSKKILIGLSLLILVLLASAVGSYYWYSSNLKPVAASPSTPVLFTVLPDESAASVVQKLFSQGLIRSLFAAKIYLRLTGQAQAIRPGGYTLVPHSSLPEIISQLSNGPKDIWVTFPEGWRREQVAARLNQNLSAAHIPFDPQAFLAQAASIEGQLFPDTYLIPPYLDSSQLINLFISNFDHKSNLNLNQSYTLSAANKPVVLTGRELLILASLIEREAKADPDRAIIADILLKRLQAGWPLQVDATVQYAVDTSGCSARVLDCKYWQPVADTKIPSAYNTYQKPGLPPAPIANPGSAAISAVLHPQVSPYWYYLTGTDGRMHYAQTLQEHNLNIDKYLQP